jgi:1,2-dihydroxy-3-keto-5-methylthiopentene dioxygenase
MAIVRIPDENRAITDPAEVTAYLASCGIVHERWEPTAPLTLESTAEEVLAAYAPEIERLKAEGAYVTADVIDIKSETPNLETLLQKFRTEHWHDEDEVRFIIEGTGLFHVHPVDKPVMAVEVGPGDLLKVPRGTHHWFDLCSERRIRAIRLFQDMTGWTPHYTGSGVDSNYQPLCMGPQQLTGSDQGRLPSLVTI